MADFDQYNNAEGINKNYLSYYYDKVSNDITFNEENTYEKIDEEINNQIKEKEKIKKKKSELLEKLKKSVIELKKNDDIIFNNTNKNFRLVDVKDDNDYYNFLFERKLYKYFKTNDDKKYINEHYFKNKENTNKELYNITNINNYNNIVNEIVGETNDKKFYNNDKEYVILNEVQFVTSNNEINNKFNVGLNNKQITKCYLFDYIDGNSENEKQNVEDYVKEKVSGINYEFFTNFNLNKEKKVNEFNFEELKESKIFDENNLTNDFQKALIEKIMENFKNNKIEHFIGIYNFIIKYDQSTQKIAHLLSSIENLKSDNVLKIADNMIPPEAKQEGGSSIHHIASQLADSDLEPGEEQFSQINATSGSSFPRIASLLAASQINMPPLLPPISSFYEKYIKYKSKYLKLQKIKSLKY